MQIRYFWDILFKGAVGLLILTIAGIGSSVSYAQVARFDVEKQRKLNEVRPDWKDCGLRKGDVNAFVSHRMSDKDAKRVKTANIQVDYGTGFSAEAREAFQRAVDIWEVHIESDVTIRIDASFQSLDEGVLGGAGPKYLYAVDTNSDDELDLYFGDALFDALRGADEQEGEADIIAQFNSDRDDWHFGEGDAPSGEIDFTTVVLHEIGHGLNYLGQTDVQSNGEGEYGMIDFDQDGSGDGVPGIYTLFLAEEQIDGSLTSITNETVYPNPSQQLGEAFTGDQIVFDGENASDAASGSTGPVPAKIYAPPSYEEGSSISHLDENTYEFEGTNALMTPQIAPAETNRQPGPIVCGQLRDMGWTLGDGCFKYFEPISNVGFAETADTDPGSVTLTWTEDTDADIQEYKIERRYFDKSFQVVKKGITAPPVTIDSSGLGQFAFRVRWVESNGTEDVSAQVRDTTLGLESMTVESSRDETGRGTVQFSWTVPPGTESGARNFAYHPERARGGDDAFERIGSTSQPTSDRQYEFTATHQAPGQYKYRVVAEDGDGNAVTSEATPVEISFDGAVFISGPFPNPAQDRATLELTAKQRQPVSVGIYNTVGEEVYFEERRLTERRPTRLQFNTGRWGNGLYLLRVEGREFARTQKFVVVK